MYYLVVTDVLNQTCRMYKLGTHASTKRMFMLKAMNKCALRGEYPKHIGPDTIVSYNEALQPVMFYSAFFIDAPLSPATVKR